MKTEIMKKHAINILYALFLGLFGLLGVILIKIFFNGIDVLSDYHFKDYFVSYMFISFLMYIPSFFKK